MDRHWDVHGDGVRLPDPVNPVWFNMPMRKVGGGTRWGTLVPCYEPTKSTLAT
jgi:hypothetical protein